MSKHTIESFRKLLIERRPAGVKHERWADLVREAVDESFFIRRGHEPSHGGVYDILHYGNLYANQATRVALMRLER